MKTYFHYYNFQAVVKILVHRTPYLTHGTISEEKLQIAEDFRCHDEKQESWRHCRTAHIRWQSIWCALRLLPLIRPYSCNVMFGGLQFLRDGVEFCMVGLQLYHAIHSNYGHLTPQLDLYDILTLLAITFHITFSSKTFSTVVTII